MTIAIIDIDNCIADDTHRLHLIDMAEPDLDKRYQEYHQAAFKDKAHNHEIIERHIEYGDTLAFVTARPYTYYTTTRIWLEENFMIPASAFLLMRPADNYDHSAVLKPSLLKHVFDSEQLSDACAYDDRQDVLNAYLSIGIKSVNRVCIRREDDVPQILRAAAETFEQRNRLYGSAYKRHGKVMSGLFPDGITLNTEEEFTRYGILVMAVSKLNRYAANFARGGHKDSAHDLSVYSAMLEELTK